MSLAVTKPVAYTYGGFTRASSAVYFDSTGTMQTAANDTPRYTYDPATLGYMGALVEQAATNLALQSDVFDNASWVKTGSAVTANQSTGAAGTSTMDLIKEDASTGQHFVAQTFAVTAGAAYSVGADFKASSRSRVTIRYLDATLTNGVLVTVDLLNGAVLTSSVVGAGTLVSVVVKKIAICGAWRITINAILDTTSTSATWGAYLLNGAGTDTYTGDNASGLYAGRAQFELGAESSYIATTTAAVTRAIDALAAGTFVTNVPENDYATIANATAYTAASSRVISASTHLIYQCQVSYTSGSPATAPESDTTHWEVVSATNRYKCLDTVSSTQSTQALVMSYVFAPGKVVSRGWGANASSDYMRVRLWDPVDGTVYDQTYDMRGHIPTPTFYDYCFAEAIAPTLGIFRDLPPYVNGLVIVDFWAASGNVACGTIGTGFARVYATGIRFGARISNQDYSTLDANKWGDTTLTQGAVAKRGEWQAWVRNTLIDSLYKSLVQYRATPCLWEGYDGLEITNSGLGFYQDFGIVIPYPNDSDCSLTIRDMT